MTLLSIKDDFLQRTLANVAGILGKLAYVSELRDNDRYVHWGLTRIYGEEATQRTLREVHRALFLQVLRKPLRELVEDVARSAAAKRVEPREFVESLVENSTLLLPQEIGGGSVAHFNSIIAALSMLFPRPRLQSQAQRANHSGTRHSEDPSPIAPAVPQRSSYVRLYSYVEPTSTLSSMRCE